MARFGQQIILPGAEFPLETAVALLDYYSKADYYVYERDDIWYLGLGAHASLVVDPKGQTATEIDSEGRRVEYHTQLAHRPSSTVCLQIFHPWENLWAGRVQLLGALLRGRPMPQVSGRC